MILSAGNACCLRQNTGPMLAYEIKRRNYSVLVKIDRLLINLCDKITPKHRLMVKKPRFGNISLKSSRFSGINNSLLVQPNDIRVE